MHYIRFASYILLFAILLELGLRFLDPPSLSYYRKVKLLHRYHPDYYVTLGENLDISIKHYAGLWEGRFTTNSLGFRGSPEPDPDKPKIACLGDSLVMGFGVGDEDTFCSQLNGIRLGGEEYQAMNLAVDAYGSLGSAKRLKESLSKLNLDIVLFFVSPNDFTVPPGLVEQGVLADDIVEKAREYDETYRRKFYIQFELTRYSYLLQALKLAQEQLAIKQILAWKEWKEEMQSLQFPLSYLGRAFYTFPRSECNSNLTSTHLDFDPTHSNPNQAKDTDRKSHNHVPSQTPICPEPVLSDSGCVDSPPSPKDLPPLPDETIYAYNLLLDSIQEKGSRLVVVFIPMQNEDIRCKNAGKHSPLYEYALRSKSFFESRGIPTYELMDSSQEICPIEEFFIPGDGHLTVQGNRWVGEKLKEYLNQAYSKGVLR